VSHPQRSFQPTSSSLAGLLLVAMLAAAPAFAQSSQQETGTRQPEAAPRAELAPDQPAPLASWRDHIRPCEAERAWERIGWHAGFADGLRAANASRRPMLLWMMNGHPLGCT
jgi:hypothetical protein